MTFERDPKWTYRVSIDKPSGFKHGGSIMAEHMLNFHGKVFIVVQWDCMNERKEHGAYTAIKTETAYNNVETKSYWR